MATAMPQFLPQAPHELWQTAASPFILPFSWQSMYQRCPRCGGSAPNVCNEVWPDKWWEDDMLGLMYQGHIPPSQRMSPWESYYANSRVQNLPAAVLQETSLHIDTEYHSHPHRTHISGGLITPPQTPGVSAQMPYYPMKRPETPTSPTLTNKYGTFNKISSFDSVQTPTQITDLGTFL
jgi:hypothetical protein